MPTGELQTSEILRSILEIGLSHDLMANGYFSERPSSVGNKSLFVPKVTQTGAMEFLKVENQSDLDALPSGKWGIREPSYESDAAMEAGLDLILVPGMGQSQFYVYY
ncbi:hypothetical protein HHX47_DHR2000535 [Lentinula edodes]|nr:hypothetical protein HHX47_DHR2000535 [Lentinula edodes]